jgi:hypothetical protein
MGWATFSAIFSQTRLVTLVSHKSSFFAVCPVGCGAFLEVGGVQTAGSSVVVGTSRGSKVAKVVRSLFRVFDKICLVIRSLSRLKNSVRAKLAIFKWNDLRRCRIFLALNSRL